MSLIPPNNEKKVLLHSCCAPCSGALIEAMLKSDIAVTLFYYNPNIQPEEEYKIRKEESRRFCEKMEISFVDAGYDPAHWVDNIKGYEGEPERGNRCTICFDIRFERTAQYAFENDFTVFTSGLGISRWKDMDQINRCGQKAAELFPGITYWTQNWRKSGGSQRMSEIAKQEEFYQQQYCGCIHSLKSANEWRKAQGRDEIQIGEDNY
ncbi:epoxyqueuosine reductase QueH [Candidatus Omnitrophota bacterium]